jgi:phenylpropionate dioxygenase-like ring-hydroxylating dioxygenase large terminal subunit
MFLHNCWYAAAWSEELGSEIAERTICGEKVVLFRTADRAVAAVSGICPHRFASLARGEKIENDRVRCPYHGLEFDATGRCVHNPHGAIPPRVRLKSYKAVERYTLVWLWWGDASAADESLIPDFACLEDSRYRTIRGTIVTNGNYELVTDNLMDLSHVGFLHAGGLGSDAIQSGKHEVVQNGTTVYSNRWCPDALAPPVWDAWFGNYGKLVDHWLDIRWDAPASMLLHVGVAPAGRNRQGGITQWGPHILTPETDTTTRYFWAAVRDFELLSDETDGNIRAAVEHAFGFEDKPMIEDIQRNMAGKSFEELQPLLLPFDKGAMLARRVLSDLMASKKRLLPTHQTAGGEWRRSGQEASA